MVGGAVKEQSAIAIGGNGTTGGGVGLDRDRIVGREARVAVFPAKTPSPTSALNEIGISSGRSDHPADQIPSQTRGCGDDFSRQTGTDLGCRRA